MGSRSPRSFNFVRLNDYEPRWRKQRNGKGMSVESPNAELEKARLRPGVLKGRLPGAEKELARAKARLEKPFESEGARVAYQQVVETLERKVDKLKRDVALAEAQRNSLQSATHRTQSDKK